MKMTQEEYYTPPSKEIFEDVKKNATKIWKTYDNEYGYADGKIGRIKDIKNVKDNCAYIVAMFDKSNQMKLFFLSKDKTKAWLRKLI